MTTALGRTMYIIKITWKYDNKVSYYRKGEWVGSLEHATGFPTQKSAQRTIDQIDPNDRKIGSVTTEEK